MARFASVLLVLLLLFPLTSCTPAGAATPSAAQSATTGEASPGAAITLRMASVTETRLLQYAISQYEKAHGGAHVELTTFNEQIVGMKSSGQAIDMAPMIQTLNTEMMSGAGPDILDVDYLPYYKYVNKGMLADIGAMMGADKSFDAGQYYGNILDACRIGGKLYAVPSMVSFSVLSCRSPYSPGGDNATMSDFLEKAMALPEGVFAFAKDDPMWIFSDYMQDNYGSFVDYAGRAATFDSDAFIHMIEAFKSLFDTKMSGTDIADGKEYAQLKDGTVAYSVQAVRRDMDVAMAKAALGEDATFTNVPVAGDAGAYPFLTRDMLAINAAGSNLDAAWEFVRTMLSEDVQMNGSPDGFPVLQSACRAKLDAMKGKDYILGKDGNRATVKFGDEDVELKPLDNASIAWLSGRIGKLNRLSSIDDAIQKIVAEELPPFFAGQKTARDAAEVIQNRVNLVLNE